MPGRAWRLNTGSISKYPMRISSPHCILWLAPLLTLYVSIVGLSSGPSVALQKTVSPTRVPAGGRVTYTITLRNEGSEPARDVVVSDRLPAGFRYLARTTTIRSNGVLIATTEPLISGNTLSWPGLSVPAARQGSYYGIHTFVQDRCDSDYLNYQLDSALALMGSGAYVKQLFYRITAQTAGPSSCAVDFVNRAYDRGLVPVIRLQGEHGGPYWLKPQPDAPGDYTSIAQAFRRVVQGLPRREGRPLYVEIWNEPNLHIEWSGAANATEYAEFLVDVAAAIRSLGDPRIRILNGALAPGGDINHLTFIDGMAGVPGALQAFDVWAAHPYPGNHPPEYNIHDGTAAYRDATIDSYLLELERLAARGRTGLSVLLTETGYALGQNTFAFEGYPPIEEGNRADYIKRAFRDYWRWWPEVLGVCPFELVDPRGEWWPWDWLYPDGRRHWQYDSVMALAKETPLVAGVLTISFQAEAASTEGVYVNNVSATAANASIPPLQGVAPVQVVSSGTTPTRTATPGATPTKTPTVTGTPPTPTNTPTATATYPCVELVRNGGFETEEGWELARAYYASEPVRAQSRSLRLGLLDEPNVYSYSSARQNIYIPAEALRCTLAFWYYPISSDLLNDVQMVRLYDDKGNMLESLMRGASDARQWLRSEHDLSAYKGQVIQLYFGVRNDGQGGTTAMYVDEVSLQACGPALPTPGPSPSATPSAPPPSPTPSPTQTSACLQLVQNPDFETVEGWELYDEALPARYTEDQARSGRRSLLVGLAEEPNTGGHCTAWQVIRLPSWAEHATLSFWYYPFSGDPVADRQYALVLGDGDVPLETVLWSATDEQRWLYREYPLDGYGGRQLKLLFGAFNNGYGGLTAMYVDDVALRVCPDNATATPTVSPSIVRSLLPLILKESSVGGARLAGLGTQRVLATLSSSPEKIASPGDWPRIALHASTERLYVAWEGRLRVFDAKDGRLLSSLPIGREVHGLFVDAIRGRVYLSERQYRRLWVVDEEGRRLIASIPLSAQPGGVAASQEAIYVALTDRDEILVLDAEEFKPMARIGVGRAPYAIAYDQARERLIVANAGEDTVMAIDRFDKATESVVSLGGLGHPQDVAVNPSDGTLYVTFAISPKQYAVARLDGRTLEVDRLWRGGAQCPWMGTYGLALDAQRGRLYVGDLRGLFVVDSRTGNVLQRLSDLGPVYPLGMALHPRRGDLYVWDATQKRIVVWNER